MEFVQHRVNTIQQLADLPLAYGCEVDLRTQGTQIILQHDPFKPGDQLIDYLDCWAQQGRQGLLILNTKEDGLESAVVDLLKQRSIDKFFFLDTALPTLIRKTQTLNKFATRFSEFEPIEFTLKFKDRCEWVWLDSYEGSPFATETLDELQRSFKTCLVSPELLGFDRARIQKFKQEGRRYDAICTKHPGDWM